MAIKHIEFLDFAKSELTKATTEFQYRNLVSRAYYFCFHCCLENKISSSLSLKKSKGSHDAVFNQVNALPNNSEYKAIKSIAYMTQMMKEIRHNADYHLDINFPKSEAEQTIRDASKILTKYNELTK